MNKIKLPISGLDERLEVLSNKYGKGRPKVSDEVLAKMYITKMEDAKKRGIEFKLSLKRYRQILNTKYCYYTKQELIHAKGCTPGTLKDTTLSNQTLTIDRIDSNKGYTDDNVVACTVTVNSLKSNLTPKEIIQMAKVLQKRKK